MSFKMSYKLGRFPPFLCERYTDTNNGAAMRNIPHSGKVGASVSVLSGAFTALLLVATKLLFVVV